LDNGPQKYHVFPPAEEAPGTSQLNSAQPGSAHPNPTEPGPPPTGASSR